jgi:hypothetical protein
MGPVVMGGGAQDFPLVGTAQPPVQSSPTFAANEDQGPLHCGARALWSWLTQKGGVL